jgi:hypothetical protein
MHFWPAEVRAQGNSEAHGLPKLPLFSVGYFLMPRAFFLLFIWVSASAPSDLEKMRIIGS